MELKIFYKWEIVAAVVQVRKFSQRIINSYITLYLFRVVLGVKSNRYVNKTIILCSNMLQEY